jgi:hypothetical protein
LSAIRIGHPSPLGASVTKAGVNFSVVAPLATRVELLLFASGSAREPEQVIELDPHHRSGTHWHVEVLGVGLGCCYGYRVFGPLQPGGPCEALDEPSDDEVMRALEKARPVQGNWPFLYEIQRNHVRISKCKISDYVDPPRHMPLVGPVQLHHAHYKCTVYFQEVKRVGWPVPHTLVDEDCQEVLYIDHDHLHMVGDVDTGCNANF